MSKYNVYRPIMGVSLNGNEYVLDYDGKVRDFDSVDEILEVFGVDSLLTLEDGGIFVEEAS